MMMLGDIQTVLLAVYHITTANPAGPFQGAVLPPHSDCIICTTYQPAKHICLGGQNRVVLWWWRVMPVSGVVFTSKPREWEWCGGAAVVRALPERA